MMKNKLLSIWIGCGSVLCSYTSCSKEMEFIDSPNEQVTIQLTTTIDGQGFSTDNENPKHPINRLLRNSNI